MRTFQDRNATSPPQQLFFCCKYSGFQRGETLTPPPQRNNSSPQKKRNTLEATTPQYFNPIGKKSPYGDESPKDTFYFQVGGCGVSSSCKIVGWMGRFWDDPEFAPVRVMLQVVCEAGLQ